MKTFEYFNAKTIYEAVNLLQQFEGKATILAGGTDLIVKAKKKLFNPRILIDISKIEEMKYIKVKGKNIHIGASTKLHEIANSFIIKDCINVLASAAKKVGSIQIRNMATIGGNVGNAAPSGDTITPLMVLHAKAVIFSKKGEKSILVSNLFRGPGITILNPFEIIKEFVIPWENLNTGMEYLKYSRRKGTDLAVVNCAVRVKVHPNDKRIDDIDIALGAVAPIPILLKNIKSKLREKVISRELCREISNYALKQITPINDVRASKAYRKQIAKIYIQKGLIVAYRNAVNYCNEHKNK